MSLALRIEFQDRVFSSSNSSAQGICRSSECLIDLSERTIRFLLGAQMSLEWFLF